MVVREGEPASAPAAAKETEAHPTPAACLAAENYNGESNDQDKDEGEGKGKDRGRAASDGPTDPKAPLHCAVMSSEEVAAITVPFAEVDSMLKRVLDEHGAALVLGVADTEECQQLESLFREDLREVCCGSKQLPRKFPSASVSGLGEMNRCQLRGLPHGRFAWAARLHPQVRRVYEVLHGTGDLVSSCDNSFFAPGDAGGADRNRSWPHVDHNCHDHSVVDADGNAISDWQVYQGLLYIWPAVEQDASTTVVWPGSHRAVYDELMASDAVKTRGGKGQHFTQLQMAGCSLIPQWHGAARRVPVPAGALFLWDSRTVHQGWTGGPRLAQPVCWEPVGRRSERARQRKLRLAALGLPSTHWASLGLPHNLVAPSLPDPVKASKRGDATLPMIATMEPVTLAAGKKSKDMWRKFQSANWSKPLPAAELRELEECIREPYRSLL